MWNSNIPSSSQFVFTPTPPLHQSMLPTQYVAPSSQNMFYSRQYVASFNQNTFSSPQYNPPVDQNVFAPLQYHPTSNQSMISPQYVTPLNQNRFSLSHYNPPLDQNVPAPFQYNPPCNQSLFPLQFVSPLHQIAPPLNKSPPPALKQHKPTLINVGTERYQIIKKLGSGGFGTVVLGENSKGQSVAIKLIEGEHLKEYRDRTKTTNEIQALEILKDCQGIVQIYEKVVTNGAVLIVMEYFNEGTLEDVVRREGGFLSEEKSFYYLKQMLLTLYSIQEHLIIHRDLKPSNIFIKDGKIKIGDFGIACARTKVTEFAGTRLYAAPEALRLSRSGVSGVYTNKVDVFSLGLVFGFMITGKNPPLSELEIAGASDEAQCLFRLMTNPDPNERSSVKELLFLFGVEVPGYRQERLLKMLPGSKKIKKTVMVCQFCMKIGHYANQCPTSRDRYVVKAKCFKCKCSGHYANQCTYKKQYTTRRMGTGYGVPTCYKCGIRGHFASRCFRRNY